MNNDDDNPYGDGPQCIAGCVFVIASFLVFGGTIAVIVFLFRL